MSEGSDLQARFQTIIGHLRSVERMAVEANAPLVDVLHQLSAVEGAILSIRRIILAKHLKTCLVRATTEGSWGAFVEDFLAASFGRTCPPKD
jgi:DNA-binding FrmR family transcriptional regulator